MGVDFSVSKTSLLSFLRNAEFTPFPAIADALLKRLNGRKLRQPVFIDVIVFNYEHTPGVESPRLLEDVDTALLEAAVVEGFNERYGADKTDFESLLQKLTTTPTTPVVDLSTLPQRLQFRLRNFIEEEATDSGLQGPTDETFISGIGADSGAVFMGQDRKLEPELIKSGPVARVKDLRAAWRVNPHVLLDFNLRRQAEWPRTFAATLVIVEEDDGDVGTDFAKAEAEVDKQIKDELNEAAESAVSAALSAIGAGTYPRADTGQGAWGSCRRRLRLDLRSNSHRTERRHIHAEGADTGGRGSRRDQTTSRHRQTARTRRRRARRSLQVRMGLASRRIGQGASRQPKSPVL